jgi:hypothetical protein
MQLFFAFNVCFQVLKDIVCLFRASIFKMALYHGWEIDVEFVPSCPSSKDPSPTPEDADLEKVLMGYLNIFAILFTNLVALKRICFAHSKRLDERTQTPQYLTFTSVSQESLDEIDRINLSVSPIDAQQANFPTTGDPKGNISMQHSKSL